MSPPIRPSCLVWVNSHSPKWHQNRWFWRTIFRVNSGFFLQEPFGFFHIESSCRCSLKPILGNRPICLVVHFAPPQIVWPRKKPKLPVSIEKNCWSGFAWKFCSPKSSGVLKSFLWHAISGVYILCSDAPKWCFHIFLWILNFEMANHFKVSKFALRVATGHKF